MLILIAVLCNALKFLVADACALVSLVDMGEVNRKKAVGLEEIQQFMEIIVKILLIEKLEVMNVVVVKKLEVASKALCIRENIASVLPQLQDLIPCALGEAAALKDIREVKELSFKFVQSDGGNLDIVRESAGHRDINRYRQDEKFD